jgi:rhomboid protease GluP
VACNWCSTWRPVACALRTGRLVLPLIPLAGIVLCVVTNNHGVGLVVGSVLGLAVSFARPRVAQET